MGKVALITGITGQDGAYLTEFLIKKGYTVHGIKRRSSMFNTDRIDHLYQDPHVENRNLILHYGDLTDSLNLTRIIGEVQPDEIYNLAAMSHVKVSFDTPEYTANADGLGVLRILEAVRLLNLIPKAYLPGIYIRVVWLGARGAAEGDYSFLSEKPLCGSETIRLLDYGELQGSLSYARFQWHLV